MIISTLSQSRVARTFILSALRVGFAVALALAVVTSLVPSSAQADTYTLDPISPTLGAIPAGPADLLSDTAVPSIGYPSAALGLIGLTPGDIVDAISDGFDPVGSPHTDYFSVTRGSFGAPGSGVFAEFSLDTPPGLTPGHPSDIFVTSPPFAGTNILAPVGFGWTFGTATGDEANAGLINPSALTPGDNVNSYDLATIFPTSPVLFSLAPGSPTLGILGATAADILGVGGLFGAVPIIVIPQALLGLPGTVGVTFDVDALAVVGLPAGPYPVSGPIPAGVIEYSLTSGSAAFFGLSGADVLGPGPGPVVVHPFFTLGLLASDDLDALDVDQRLIPEPSSVCLAGLGLAALAGMAYRRRRTLTTA